MRMKKKERSSSDQDYAGPAHSEEGMSMESGKGGRVGMR